MCDGCVSGKEDGDGIRRDTAEVFFCTGKVFWLSHIVMPCFIVDFSKRERQM